ncbi:hypothetical protein FFY45_06595 [Xanthomonas hortorum]|nr:hypothetical protein [Xanthomonas hortorum]
MRLICGLAAGPLPAHHRATRRKYVLVASSADRRAADLRICCRAIASPPSRDTPQVRPCSVIGRSARG